jgi:PAS domain S-box-containing protein
MKKPSDEWDRLRRQILGFGEDSAQKSYYPALRRRVCDLERAEARLRESEERLQLALHGAELGMWDWHVQPNMLIFDDRAAEMLGYHRDELPSRLSTWIERLHPDDAPRALQVLEDHLAGRNESLANEFRLRHKDGRWVWIAANGRVIERSADGTPLRACGTHRDITEQKRTEDEHRRLEAQVRHKQKLESLGVLAGGIAHDFNNLLMAILGNADLALADVHPSSPLWPCLDEIRTTAGRASELTNQMLAYSGRGRFVVETVRLGELVAEMGRLLEVTLPKKVTLRYELDRDLPPVEVDATQVRQVVMNLVTNAADAMGDRPGTVTITTRRVEADRNLLASTYLGAGLAEGPYVCLEVSDEGCGMDEQTQQRLFEPFFTTKAAGRGLGMAAVLGIVRGHGGTIRVASAPGRGSSFEVFLPSAAADPAPHASPAAFGEQRDFAGRKVLVVDDEESVRRVARRMLERMGASVLLARDGVEALSAYQREGRSIDLVLLDVTMPRMDGRETSRQLRRLDPDVRIVLSSGFDASDATERFASMDVAGFVQKPYLLETLAGALREALEEPAHRERGQGSS